MKLTILFFGQLTDISGSSNMVMENITDTDTLSKKLVELYPELASKKYIIAVNAKMIRQNTLLTDNATIALMPPFSGG